MRVLVVEDERKIAEFIKRGLKEEGYAVDIAPNGEEGHFLASTNEYDAVILDIMLPGMDGIEVCRMLRAGKCDVPILMLTARDAVKDKVSGLDSGANDYLTKPFAFEELLARLRALVRFRHREVQSALAVDDLVMDVIAHLVRRQGREISLTQKEYALLEYLMRNTDKVATRTMISEHVWDVSFDTDTNVIDVYVSRLRDKIDKGHARKLIHTLRGRGYMLSVKSYEL